MIVVTINGTNHTNKLIADSLTITDQLNQSVDTATFDLQRITDTGKTFKPELGQEVIITEGATRIFAGIIVDIAESIFSTREVRYAVKCKDYTHLLDGKLVVEKYTDMSVTDIIDDMVTKYAPSGFTNTYAVCPIVAKTVVFNRVSFSACLEKLSKLTGYQWYVDYNKNIYFFERNSIGSPFGLNDDDDSYIFDSLILSNDITQLRNRVYIRGGEAVGASRSEYFSWDGTKKTFALANKYSVLPTVTVNGTPAVGGLDYINDETGYDFLWSFQEKYIKFTTAFTATNGTNNIVVSGLPLFPIQVQAENPVSITKYGTYEYAKKDLTIKSKEEALKIAQTELQAYSDGLDEGGFDTYQSGLRSGQIINIKSVIRGVDENYLIQKVQYKQLTISKGVYKISLASLRTTSIIDLLIGLLRAEDRYINDSSDETLEKSVFTIEKIKIGETFVSTLSGITMADEIVLISEAFTNQGLDYGVEFCLGDFVQTGTKRVFILDGSPLQ
jgi:hypothetical protein